jgi:lipopolysaccharide heptosyltransferase II
MRSLVIQTSFIGDTVLTTPLISALAQRGAVDVVVTPLSAGLLANHPDVRRVYRYDKRGADRGIAGFRAMARTVGAADDDAAYLAQGSLRSAALARAAGYGTRIGFDTSAGRIFHTASVRYCGSQHHSERLWRLGAGDSARPPATGLHPRLFPGSAEVEAVEELLRESGHDGELLIALAPGSVWATKRWPYFADLARQLDARARVVVVGSADDRGLAAEVVAATAGRAIDASGRLSLLASAALIGRARVLVTNDSAPQHLASAMGTPTITVFGPTVPAFGFGPLAPQSLVAGVDGLACRPCDRHGPARCPLGHWRCMRELDVAAVAAMVRALPGGEE